MGGCFSALPTPNIDAARVAKVVAKRGAQIVKDTKEKFELFKEEMKKHAPSAYVVPKEWCGDKEVNLTEGVDDDKKVRLVALTAASGEKLKEETREDVWSEVEPDVASQVADHNELIRKGALTGARKASDKASDAALDQLIKKLITHIEEGKDVSDPDTPADTAAAAAPVDEKKENAEHETEKKEQAENTL
jgi:hypothetical protein